MTLNRREALGCFLLGASAIATTAGRLRAAEDKPLLVIVSGIDPSISPERLSAALDDLVSREIPIGCAIALQDPSGNPLQQESDLASLLRQLRSEYPRLIELLVHVPRIADEAPYFQVRRASEAQTDFCRVLEFPGSMGDARACSLTLLTEEPAQGSVPLGGVRAAGFRNVLFLPRAGGSSGYGEESMGVMQIFGGFEVTGEAGSKTIAAALTAEIDKSDPVIAYLPLAEFSGLSDARVSQKATAIGDATSAAIASGRIYCALPSELHQRSGASYAHYIALRVDGLPIDGALGEDQKAFIASLQQAGIAASYAGRVSDADLGAIAALDRPADGVDFSASPIIRPEDLAEGDMAPRTIARRLQDISLSLKSPAGCVTTSSTESAFLAQIGEAGASSLSVICGTPSDFIGLDRDGVLRVPTPRCLEGTNVAATIEDLTQGTGVQRDALVVVGPEAIATTNASKALAAVLSGLSRMPENEFVDLEQYRTRVMPKDPAFDLLRSMKSGTLLADIKTGDVEPGERAELLKDAEIAWQYIARVTDAVTGLAPGTAWLDGALVTYPFVTMWDVASLLIGLVSARSIGIIGDQEFAERTTTALAHLSDSEMNGLRLPRLVTATDGKSKGEDGYDASDVGRLLVCLKVLEQYAGTGLGVRKIVERWDLDKTLVNRRLHNFEDGKFVDVHDSNYANYLVRGFAAWGFDVQPAYELPPSDKGADAQMRLVNEVASRGPVGTEPHVLEEIELGYSEVARTIADMLYTAQLTEYASTGKIVCVSEGSLDQEPWFTYQGYQFGAETDPWSVNAIDNLSKYKTAAFRRSVEMVNTKAAFLWAAVRRQAYSRTLLTYVRERARIEHLGYASGIFVATGEPTANYSDINTNGIILASIAYILGGQRPLATARISSP